MWGFIWKYPDDIKNTDPDFYEIKKNFIYGDVYAHGNLDDKMRELIARVVAVANQTNYMEEPYGPHKIVGFN